MEPKKIVTCFAAVIISTVLIMCFMLTTSEEEADELYSAYNRTTQDFNKTSVETIVRQLQQESEEPSINNPNVPGVNNQTVNAETWLQICDLAHKQFGGSGLRYAYNGSGVVTKSDGSTIAVRPDCSGYVGYCIYSAGWATTPKCITSGSDLSPYGFTKVTDGSLLPGDVVAWPGSHIEVYVSGEKTVYNWGSSASAENKYAGVTDVNTVDSTSTSGHTFPPTVVWRPQALGSAESTESSIDESEFTAENCIDNMKRIVFIDAGHGCEYNVEGSPGPYGWAAVGNGDGITEAVFTGQLQGVLCRKLRENGYIVKTLASYGVTRAKYGNRGRGIVFNASDASIMIQLHWDGSLNRNVHGYSILLCHGSNNRDAYLTEGYLGKCIRNHYSSLTGIAEFSTYFYDIRTGIGLSKVVTKPTILIETGFGSNDGDRAILESPEGQEKAAQAIVDALDEFFETTGN